MRTILTVFLSLILSTAAAQSQKVSLGFYNLENLFDTIPSPFHNDTDYTPQGRNNWNTARYQEKITNIARVIDHMNLDILGIAEVENEQSVRDLIAALDTDYNYIHRNTRDGRGLDLALIYKGDKFIPNQVRQINSGTSRQFLYVRGELKGRRIDIVVCHLPSRLNKNAYRNRAFSHLAAFADSLTVADKSSRLIITGDFNAAPSDKLFRKHFGKTAHRSGYPPLFSPLAKQAALGAGTYRYKGQWTLIDNILLSYHFRNDLDQAGIFVKDYMLHKQHDDVVYPYRSYGSGKHLSGYSDHLPVYVTLDLQP